LEQLKVSEILVFAIYLPKLDFGDFSKKIWTLKDKILVSVQVQEKLSRVTDNVNP
jgi:hypothetical protein